MLDTLSTAHLSGVFWLQCMLPSECAGGAGVFLTEGGLSQANALLAHISSAMFPHSHQVSSTLC